MDLQRRMAAGELLKPRCMKFVKMADSDAGNLPAKLLDKIGNGKAVAGESPR